MVRSACCLGLICSLGRFMPWSETATAAASSSEGFFSKFARSVLRHIRVASKQELRERIMTGIEDVNRNPVIHTWSYRLAEAARYDSNQGNTDLALQ